MSTISSNTLYLVVRVSAVVGAQSSPTLTRRQADAEEESEEAEAADHEG